MPGSEKTLYTEAGVTGLTRFGGYISEEWLRELQGSHGIRIYREMRDNDAIVGAFLYAVEMLLRQVTWRVEKGGDSPADTAARDFLESCLEDMESSWQDVVSEILSMLPFGWALLETVYKKRNGPKAKKEGKSKFTDGRIGWRKWSLRAQETLFQWKYDDENQLIGMEQQAPPDYSLRYIPIEKALLFRMHVTKDNPEGRSLLRNAYRSWYMKKNIEEVEAIGIERDLAGLPVVWLPAEIIQKNTSETITAFNDWKKVITNIRRDEQEGLIMPLAYDAEGRKAYDISLLTTGSRRQFDTNAIIARYDQRISVTVMADFLLLGTTNVGSFAMASSKTDLFGVALGTILDSIMGVLNTDAIPRLFDLNDFGELTNLPKIIHEDVESPDLAILGEFINKLAGAKMPLFPDTDLENYLRSAGSLPNKPDVLQDTLPIAGTVETGTDGNKDVPNSAKPDSAPAGLPTNSPELTQVLAKNQKDDYDIDRREFLEAVVELRKAVKEELNNL